MFVAYPFAGAGPPRLVTVAIDRRNDIRDDEATADLTFRVSADDIVMWCLLLLFLAVMGE